MSGIPADGTDAPTSKEGQIKGRLARIWAGNFMASIGRSILIVAAVGLLLKFGDAEISGYCVGVVEAVLEGVATNWYWVVAVVLLVVAFWNQSVWRACKSFWLWVVGRRYSPLGVAGAGGLLLWIDWGIPASVMAFLGGCLLLVGALTWFLWRSPSKDDEAVDKLHRSYFVERLKEVFSTENTSLRRVAVFGDWGIGKTTLLKLLRRELGKRKREKFKVGLVNPWKARTPEEAWAILAKGFDQALGLPSAVSLGWAKHPVWSWLKNLVPFSGSGIDLVKFFDGSTGATSESHARKLNQLLERRRIKVVLLVDDMERADPEVIRKMFPVIARLRELKHCFFVFAIDRARIAKAFKESDGKDDETKGYLDKVFDLHLTLPEPSVEDVARMCSTEISEKETPKLASCFPEISKFLPRNPRTALRFVNDAKTKEVLFLSRYRETEHPYYVFFLIRLIEVEFPGVAEALQSADGRDFFQSKSAATAALSDEKPSEGEPFERMVGFITESISIAPEGKVRFNDLMKHLVDTSSMGFGFGWYGGAPFDIRWMVHDHMRLINLSASEREILEGVWAERAGTCGIEAMLLDEALSGKIFSDMRECACQLIEFEGKHVLDSVLACYGNRSEKQVVELLENAQRRTTRLSRHLKFALKEESDLDLSAFGEPFFDQWLEFVDRCPLSGFEAVAAKTLAEVRASLHLDMVSLLPLARCHSGATLGVRSDRPDHDVDRTEWEQHSQKLRERMVSRITGVTVEAFEKGIDEHWPPSGLDRQGFDFFCDPRNWLQVGSEDWLEPLRGLVTGACGSVTLANSFAQVVFNILHVCHCGECANSHIRERRQIANLAKKYPDYLKLFWEAACSPRVDEAVKERIERDRGRSKSKEGEATYLDKGFIDEFFPRRGSKAKSELETESKETP